MPGLGQSEAQGRSRKLVLMLAPSWVKHVLTIGQHGQNVFMFCMGCSLLHILTLCSVRQKCKPASAVSCPKKDTSFACLDTMLKAWELGCAALDNVWYKAGLAQGKRWQNEMGLRIIVPETKLRASTKDSQDSPNAIMSSRRCM